jgi:hypothetical protein
MSFFSLLAVVAPVFVIVAAGYAIRRLNWLSAEADASLLRLVVNLLFPCLILDTILGNAALDETSNMLLAPAAGFCSVTLGFGVAWFAAPLLGLRASRERRTFAFTTGIYNYGYIPLPLVQKLFDERTAAVLFIHNIGVEIALWTVGLLIISGSSPEHPLRRIFSAPMIAIFGAIGLHFAGARAWLPAWVMSAVHLTGAAGIPLGLILSGATVCDQARNVSLHGAVADSLGACLLRLGVVPVLMIAAARLLPCSAELRHVVLVQAAMPCAVIPVILAKHYSGNPAMALRIILCTTGAALVTIPWWLHAGARWLK